MTRSAPLAGLAALLVSATAFAANPFATLAQAVTEATGMTHTSSRTFYTSDSPARASQVVGRMTVSDGSGGGRLPPGVSATRTGPGQFSASGPFTHVEAGINVSRGPNGGSYVTETTRSASLIPGGARVADAVHSVFTSHQAAYSNARSRSGGGGTNR